MRTKIFDYKLKPLKGGDKMGIDYDFAAGKAAEVNKRRDQERKEGKEQKARSVFGRNPFNESPFSDLCSYPDSK